MAKDKDAEPAFTQQGDGAESQSGTSSSIFQSSGNGQTEHAPLLIQGSEAGFEAFLECVFGDHSTLYRQPAIFWLQALQVIDLYDAPPILNIANHHLSAARDLDPAIRLHLAMHYHLDEWIPLADLTQAQITNIGFSAYIILAEVKAKITEHRTLCALACPPVIHNDGCRDHRVVIERTYPVTEPSSDTSSVTAPPVDPPDPTPSTTAAVPRAASRAPTPPPLRQNLRSNYVAPISTTTRTGRVSRPAERLDPVHVVKHQPPRPQVSALLLRPELEGGQCNGAETADFPNVKWWTQKAYDPQSSDLSTIDDDGGDDDDEGPSSKKYKGYPWALAAHPRTALNFVGNKQRAPSQRTDADMEVVNISRPQALSTPLEAQCDPEAGLPSWKRNWVQGGGHQSVTPAAAIRPTPKAAFKSANLFGFGAPRPSRISAATSKLDTLAAAAASAPPAPPPAPLLTTASSGQVDKNPSSNDAGGSTDSGTSSHGANGEKPKPSRRPKDADAPLKANQTNSAKNLCIKDYLAARPGLHPTAREFEVYWDNLTTKEKDPFVKRSKAANAEKKANANKLSLFLLCISYFGATTRLARMGEEQAV
ncbi:hypothetical protein R3P38DRAFT_3246164 [Favolaschia claudopus]|uniref:Uncharacterized protein n=1 Tax=Favolaschia claudopus TaxID=2862362 RepID=A0AAV9YZE6_9AGAR